jgi:unsaturated rhamnogalacturonyl hydrolase
MIKTTELEKQLNLVTRKMMVMKNSGMREKYPISLIDINCWEWPQGVGIFGLLKYYRQTGNRQIRDFLLDWFDKRMREGLPEKNVNTTSPMLTLTYLYEETQKKEYLALIREWSDWIMRDKKLIRTGDGCFQHMITGDSNDSEILIDTLFMAVLFLERAGKILNRRDYIDEANYQILNHIKYLLDKREGLFYHGFNFKRNDNYGGILWGRGNCWYTVVIMELVQDIELDPAVKRYFLSVWKNQVRALKRYSDPACGLWHTVINDPGSYLEISASAGFLYGIMQGVRLGIFPKEEYAALIGTALSSIMDYISEDGTVRNVSYGTPIGLDAEFYRTIPCCPMTYGQAMMILLLQEAMQPFWHEEG